MLRSLFCAEVSADGRRSAKLRRSPLTLYCRAGNVTFLPEPPLRRSQTLNPISLRPASGPSVKCSSASASLPGGFPLSFGVILIVIVPLPSRDALGEPFRTRTADGAPNAAAALGAPDARQAKGMRSR